MSGNHSQGDNYDNLPLLSSFISSEDSVRANRFNIVNVDSEVHQIPDRSNGFVAVVKTRIMTHSNNCFSGIGVASPKMIDGSTSPQKLMDRATENSLVRAVDIASLSFGSEKSKVKTVKGTQDLACQSDKECPSEQSIERGSRSGDHWSKGHCKKPGSMTSPQVDLITIEAEKKGMTFDQVVSSANLDPKTMSSHEASELIKSLKKKKG